MMMMYNVRDYFIKKKYDFLKIYILSHFSQERSLELEGIGERNSKTKPANLIVCHLEKLLLLLFDELLLLFE